MDKLYRFRIDNDVRILSACRIEDAKIIARKLFGPQTKDARISVFPRHLAPMLTGGKVYDDWTATQEAAGNDYRRLRAMQKASRSDWSYRQDECRADKAVSSFLRMLKL